MAVSFERVVIWAHTRRLVVLAGAAFLLALSAIGLSRVTFDADVLRLLPATGQTIPAFRHYLERFGTLDDLFVVFSAPPSYAITDYDAQIADWVDALRDVPELRSVDSGQLDGWRDWGWLADRQLLLLDERRLAEALARFRADEMRLVLSDTRELLALPSPEITALVREDPLRLHELLQRQLGESGLQLSTSGYVSQDGQRRLVIAQPAEPPYDTAFSRALIDRLAAVAAARRETVAAEGGDEQLPALHVEFVGGHRIAVEAEAVVKRESITNGVGSLVLILPLLFIAFRSPWLLVVGAVPSAAALLVAIGLLGLAGATLSAAATGAAAMMFGLGVDGVVLLYVAHRHALAQGLDPLAAIRALGEPSASMLLGMWTTAATFLGLIVVDFPSLEQLGLLIGVGMLVCGVLTLVIVPAALPRGPRASRHDERSLSMPRLAAAVRRHRLAILVTAAVLTIFSVALVAGLRVDPTLERLRSVTPGARLVEQVTAEFGLGEAVLIVLDEGPDLQALLERNEALVARIRRLAPSLTLHAPATLLPSERMQAARRRIVRESLPDLAVIRSSLEAATLHAGFRAGAFRSFSDRLPRLTSDTQRITYDDFAEHRLDDVLRRFITRDGGQWTLASYAFAETPAEIDVLRAAVAASDGTMVVTGLPLVNAELSARFMPQFLLGLGVGSVIVIGMIALTFRDWRLALLTLVPTALGLIWAGGFLALIGYELDLFSVFAVITFIGIGIDYGVHLVHRYRERRDATRATSELAFVILVAGAVTLLGYGTLIVSSYPPLQSIGIVSVASVVGLVAASILVLPALLTLLPEDVG